MGCAYKLTSPSNKSYIGVTKKTAQERFEKHKEHAFGKRDSGALYSALRKYGPDNFRLEVLVEMDDWESLLQLEKDLIKQFNTLSPNGYNIAEGGQGGQGKFSEQAIRNISAAQKKRFQNSEEYLKLMERSKKAHAILKERWRPIIEAKKATRRAYLASPEYKKLHSDATKAGMAKPEIKAKVIQCAKSRAANPEWRKKIGASKKGKVLGPHSREWNNKIAEARRREWQNPVMRAKRLKAFGYVEKNDRSSGQIDLFSRSSSVSPEHQQSHLSNI